MASREPTSPAQPRPARAAASATGGLTAARQLADAGRLEEAAQLCQLHLRSKGPSAQAYYLLGLVSDAQGSEDAIEYYRKALYLEPDHYESLLHMAFLLLKNGESARARNFLNRAGRLRSETEKQAES
jgi:chemotaxis protein methyltransferase WspC